MRRLKAVLADSGRWSEAHGVFDVLRWLLLELQDRDRNPEEELAYSALFVGESAARVAYKATDPFDPFDEDTEPWIVACLHHYASSLQDEQALDRAWDAVSRVLPGRIGDGSSGGGISA